MYKAIEYFTDLQDNNFEYKVGDVYPREGYTPTDERIKELAGKKNLRGRAVIAKETAAEVEEIPAEEKPKKRGRKKAEE